MKRKIVLSIAVVAVLIFTGCAGGSDADLYMADTGQV